MGGKNKEVNLVMFINDDATVMIHNYDDDDDHENDELTRHLP